MSVRERLEEALSTSIGSPDGVKSPTPTRQSSTDAVSGKGSRTPSIRTGNGNGDDDIRDGGVSRILVKKPTSGESSH
jgi:hypothetical protein